MALIAAMVTEKYDNWRGQKMADRKMVIFGSSFDPELLDGRGL